MLIHLLGRSVDPVPTSTSSYTISCESPSSKKMNVIHRLRFGKAPNEGGIPAEVYNAYLSVVNGHFIPSSHGFGKPKNIRSIRTPQFCCHFPKNGISHDFHNRRTRVSKIPRITSAQAFGQTIFCGCPNRRGGLLCGLQQEPPIQKSDP